MPVEVYLITRQIKSRQSGWKEGFRRGWKEGFRRGWMEGFRGGWMEGFREGYQPGRQEERARWLAWNQRREEALRAGRDFAESPPGETGKVKR